MKVVKSTDGNEVLQKGWVIVLPSEKQSFGTKYFKIISVSDYGARCVSYKSIQDWEFEDREDERQFYDKLKSVFISSRSSVDVIGAHRNNLDRIALKR